MTKEIWSHSKIKKAAKQLLSTYGERPVIARSTAINAQQPFMQYDFQQNKIVYAQPYNLDDIYVRVIQYLIRIGEYDAIDGGADDFQFTRPIVLVINQPFHDVDRVGIQQQS